MFSRFHDAVNSGDVALIAKTIDEAVDPNLLFRTPVPNGMTGVQALKQVRVTLLHAFPDLHVAIQDVIAEGGKVDVVAGSRPTHHPFRTREPTCRHGVLGRSAGELAG